MAGIVVVILGAVVLAVAIFALREPKGHVSAGSDTRTTTVLSTVGSTPNSPGTSRRSSSAPSSSSRSGSSAGTNAKSLPLVVLNTTATSGLGRQAAQRFENGGWTVTRFAGYQNNIVSTCAYYDPSVAGAKAAAEALQKQYPTIKRVKEKFAELPSGPVVVVLTSDYSPN